MNMKKELQKLLIILILFIAIGLFGYKIGRKNSTMLAIPKQEEDHFSPEERFPPLYMPLEYFDANDVSIGAGLLGKSYNVIFNSEEGYRSYPTTTISLNPDLYSSIPTPLPPIKSDDQISSNDPLLDFMGAAKRSTVKQYGDLGRRFVGEAKIGWNIYDVKDVDVDKDGEKETLVSLDLTGANIIGQRNVLIKGDKIIFSTDEETFSTLTPAKNGNGFFLQWDDNFKNRDGHMTTRFIYDGKSFVPVYEQQTRYIRINI